MPISIEIARCNAAVMVPDVVRNLIRHRIAQGYLPRQHTIDLWHGGASFGHVCDGCGATIASNDVMFLLCGENWSLIRFHIDCYQVWDFEKAHEVGIVEQTQPDTPWRSSGPQRRVAQY